MLFTNVSYTNVIASSFTSMIPMSFLLEDGESWECSNTDNYTSACNTSYWIYVVVCFVIASILLSFDLGK